MTVAADRIADAMDASMLAIALEDYADAIGSLLTCLETYRIRARDRATVPIFPHEDITARLRHTHIDRDYTRRVLNLYYPIEADE